MSSESKARENLANLARSIIIGRIIERAFIRTGSILCIDFILGDGDERRPYLRIECAWRLEYGGDILVASEDDRQTLKASVRKLEGAIVNNIYISIPSLGFQIDLDDGLRLFAFPIYATNMDYENWIFITPSRMAYTAGPGKGLTVKRSDQP